MITFSPSRRWTGRENDDDVLAIDGKGHGCLLQITDARPDTSSLSGATLGEAVSLGKVNPDRLPDAVVCYVDSTIALPLITAYALAKHPTRLTRSTNAGTPCWRH
jgi:deoxyhypusine synthase